MKDEKQKIVIALTSDPYHNIYGYALVFIRLFDYVQKNKPDLSVVLFSNDGTSSKVVNNAHFKQIRLNPSSKLLRKFIELSVGFIRNVWKYDKHSIVIANAEIPELLAACVLKMKFKRTYCLIQDLCLRDTSPASRMIHSLRMFLIRCIGNVIFTNRHTMNQFSMKGNKFYIGNPIF